MVQCAFGLAWISINIGKKGFTTDRIARYCADGVNLILSRMHGSKNLAEAIALKCGGEVVEDGILFWLGGQLAFSIIYIHTEKYTTLYIGIQSTNTPNNCKRSPLHSCHLVPPPTSKYPNTHPPRGV